MYKKTLIFASIIISFINCSSDNDNPQSTNHIQHFGFSLVDTYWDDPSDTDSKTNYIDEVSSFTNLADILVIAPTDDIIDNLAMFQSHDVNAYLHLNEIFYEVVDHNAPSGNRYALRNDYEFRWNTFVSTNNLSNHLDAIQAFYIGEEPTWNGITFQDLKMVSDLLEVQFPEIPTLIIEAAPAINDLQIPSSVDWIGFDHYFIKNPKNDTQFLNELNLLKSKFTTTEQKLVLVMDTHFIESIHSDIANTDISEMKEVAQSYYELALSESKTIAIIGYFWPNGFDHPTAIGARNMPDSVQQEYVRIGKEITNK